MELTVLLYLIAMVYLALLVLEVKISYSKLTFHINNKRNYLKCGKNNRELSRANALAFLGMVVSLSVIISTSFYVVNYILMLFVLMVAIASLIFFLTEYFKLKGNINAFRWL